MDYIARVTKADNSKLVLSIYSSFKRKKSKGKWKVGDCLIFYEIIHAFTLTPRIQGSSKIIPSMGLRIVSLILSAKKFWEGNRAKKKMSGFFGVVFQIFTAFFYLSIFLSLFDAIQILIVVTCIYLGGNNGVLYDK